MAKAFAYLRVSGKGQVEGDGFPRQLAAIKAYAKANNIRVVQVFEERGISGVRDSDERPAWTDMLAALHGDGVRTILIERLDRLARDLMVQERIIADLQKQGFALISVEEPDLMATDPQRVFYRQIMGAVAQLDKSNIVAKLRGARMRKRATEGRCEGRKPFGWYEGEQTAIERMKALQASGLSIRAVSKKLNDEGVPTRTGKPWHDAVVGRILKQEE